MKTIWIVFIVLLIVLVPVIVYCLHMPNHAGFQITYSDCKTQFDHLEFSRQFPVNSSTIYHQDSFNPTLFRLPGDDQVHCLERSRKFAPGAPCITLDSSLVLTHLGPGSERTGPPGSSMTHAARFQVAEYWDARFFHADGKYVYLMCSACDIASPQRRTFWPAILVLNASATALIHAQRLDLPKGMGNLNKNWTVFRSSRNQWLVHTHSFPRLRIYELAHVGSTWRLEKEVVSIDTTTFFSGLQFEGKPIAHLRGTSNWVKTNQNTYLTILHFSERPKSMSAFAALVFRPYRSVFVECDADNFKPIARTNALCFGHNCQNIQFASSLLWADENSKTDLLVGYGLMDKASYVGVISLTAVRARYVHKQNEMR